MASHKWYLQQNIIKSHKILSRNWQGLYTQPYFQLSFRQALEPNTHNYIKSSLSNVWYNAYYDILNVYLNSDFK